MAIEEIHRTEMGRSERAKERREKRLQELSDLRRIPYTEQERWWGSETVAVVTGANRGIGYEIARQLAVHGLSVILTSRDNSKGHEATESLLSEGLNVAFHQLDILDHASVKLFAEWIQQNYGGMDILVNNAGVNFNLGADNSVEFAERVISTNYFGTKRMIETIVPLMKHSTAGARIVNRLEDKMLREQLADEDSLSEELINRTVTRFLEQVEKGSWVSGGWPKIYTDYSVSKLAVNAYTRFVAKTFSNRPEGRNIHINCYCPGWVKTGMSGWAGNISAEEGADTGVWLALLPGQTVTGKFFAERREIDF
ncbi:(+)-neomenthol dehydrogenase isoform X2 [Macadamia integrifolia]|uniref:(+)-neomenthol dehydrogenase isoform X2 n=1 Tax=Macadamia integrifolia TaxID=60698 RepID=UPI001C500C32|nr:(+)-neomenthol dehydrogenase isoform X2 [Macadamia integrifolia]